jgi:NTE family protein
MNTRPTTALVLAGGGSLGAVQVGMLRELLAVGEQFDFVVGASAGAINGAYFAANPTREGVAALEQIWRTLTRRDVMPLSFATLINVLRRRDHIVDGNALRRLLERHLGDGLIDNTALPLHVIAADLLSGDEIVLSSGPVVRAVLASAAIPGIFPPVSIDERLLIDGGIANNAPISAAVVRGATRIMLLPTGFACALKSLPRGAAARAMHAVNLLVSRQLVRDIGYYADRADICVVPTICPLEASSYDYSVGASLIDRAAECTRAWIKAGGLRSSGAPPMLHEHTH